jgi:hypothetical protein
VQFSPATIEQFLPGVDMEFALKRAIHSTSSPSSDVDAIFVGVTELYTPPTRLVYWRSVFRHGAHTLRIGLVLAPLISTFAISAAH